MLSVIVNILFSSSMFIITKYALHLSKPLFLVGFRALTAGVLLTAWGLYTGEKKSLARITKPVRILIGIMGLFGVCLKSALVFWGMQYTTSAKASFLFNLSPFISALASIAIFGERMTRKKVAGLICGLAGFIYLLYASSDLHDLPVSQLFSWLSWGELAIFGAVLSNVVALVSLRILKTKHQLSSSLFNGLSMLVGGMLVIPFLHVFEAGPYIKTSDTTWLVFIFAVLLANLIGILQLKAYNLQRYRVTFMAFASSSMPMFVALFEFMLFKRVPSFAFCQAYVIVLFGLWLFYQDELKQGYIA